MIPLPGMWPGLLCFPPTLQATGMSGRSLQRPSPWDKPRSCQNSKSQILKAQLTVLILRSPLETKDNTCSCRKRMLEKQPMLPEDCSTSICGRAVQWCTCGRAAGGLGETSFTAEISAGQRQAGAAAGTLGAATLLLTLAPGVLSASSASGLGKPPHHLSKSCIYTARFSRDTERQITALQNCICKQLPSCVQDDQGKQMT